jgi:hypothetical protein
MDMLLLRLELYRMVTSNFMERLVQTLDLMVALVGIPTGWSMIQSS